MLFFSFLVSILSLFCCNRASKELAKLEPAVETQVHYLGNTPITLSISRYGAEPNPVFLQLHHNESTAAEVARHVLEERGGTFISIENKEERYISFSLHNKRYSFDPNRMFTKKGIRESLSFLSRYHPAPAREVEKFAKTILQKLNTDTVIALHNNTDKEYSITSYQTEKIFRQSRSQLFRNRKMDSDDFFITTDLVVFRSLSKKNYNVILHNNAHPVDDGSLSVYLGKRNKTYINVEAEHGHFSEQKDMVVALYALFSTYSDSQ